MPEAFKNAFNPQLIFGMARHFKHQWSEFNSRGFTDAASKNLQQLELKQRSEQIMHAMADYLPSDFAKSGNINHALIHKYQFINQREP